jgi:hypothetical protein
VGTELVFGESPGLLLKEELECPFGQTLGRRRGDLLEGSEVDIESGPVVAEGSFGDDLAPLGGQCPEPAEFLGCEVRGGHRSSGLEVAAMTASGFLSHRGRPAITRANRDVTSRAPFLPG